MRALLIFLLFIAFGLWGRWYYICHLRHLCASEQRVEETVRPLTLQLMQGDSVVLDGYEEFYFEQGEITPEMTPDNEAFLDTVAAILRANTTLNLDITGLYRDSSEQNLRTGYFENIGLPRAEAIRRRLTERGIDGNNRITLDFASGDEELTSPLEFDLYVPELPSEFEQTAFTFTNMTFSADASFAYDSDEFNPSAQVVSYADSVQKFLELNPEMMLTIVGHTDSIGSHAYNDDLGLRRAQNARAYFRDSLGVEAPIEVETAGKRRPVAPNSNPDGTDNPEGREKNRRVNFIIEDAAGDLE